MLLKLKSIGEIYMGILHEINTPVQYIYINNKIVLDSILNFDKFFKRIKRGINAGKFDKKEIKFLKQMIEEKNLHQGIPKMERFYV